MDFLKIFSEAHSVLGIESLWKGDKGDFCAIKKMHMAGNVKLLNLVEKKDK